VLGQEGVERVGEFFARLLVCDGPIKRLQCGLGIVEVQLDALGGVRRQLRLDALLKSMHGVEYTARLRIRCGDK
jgi:hypothetical protein